MTDIIDYDPNSNRESYLKAFEEFKERRKNSCTTTDPSAGSTTGSICKMPPPDSTDNSSDIYSTVSRVVRPCDDSPSDYGYDGCSGGEEYSTIVSTTSRKKRHSMPAQMQTKASRNKNRNNVVDNINNVIHENEIHEFENQHCNKIGNPTDADQTYFVGSPPVKFFKFNSKPFEDSVSPSVQQQQNEQHDPMMLTTVQLQRGGRNSKIPACNGESTDSNLSGSYRHFDNNSGGSDEGVVMNHHTTTTNTKTSTTTTTTTPVSAANPLGSRNRRKKGSGYRFEHQINKYGEVVEYAMPEAVSSYSDDRDTDSPAPRRERSPIPLPYSPVLPAVPVNSFTINGPQSDGNFGFTNNMPQINETIPTVKNHQSMMITDLDESLDLDHSKYMI